MHGLTFAGAREEASRVHARVDSAALEECQAPHRQQGRSCGHPHCKTGETGAQRDSGRPGPGVRRRMLFLEALPVGNGLLLAVSSLLRHVIVRRSVLTVNSRLVQHAMHTEQGQIRLRRLRRGDTARPLCFPGRFAIYLFHLDLEKNIVYDSAPTGFRSWKRWMGR